MLHFLFCELKCDVADALVNNACQVWGFETVHIFAL